MRSAVVTLWTERGATWAIFTLWAAAFTGSATTASAVGVAGTGAVSLLKTLPRSFC